MNKRIERELHRTKVVIRHLPCQLTEERLHEELTPLPSLDYMYFVQGNASYNQFGYSRLYINFTDENDIVPFKEKWDGYLFEDDAGCKMHAVVEFAPFQRVPRKNRRKPDPKCGTIEADPEFVAFSEAYEQDVEPLPSIDKTTYMLEEPKAASKETTALIEYLKDKKEQRARARAAKEAKRREKKAKEKSRKEKVEPVRTASSAKVIHRQGGRGEGSGERGGPKPVSAAAQPAEGKGLPMKAPPTASTGQDASSSRPSSQPRDYADEASVRIIARPGGGGGGGGGRRSGQVAEKGRQKVGNSGEREFSDAGATKKSDSSLGSVSGKDDRVSSQLQGGGGGERRERGGRGRGEKRPDRTLYNPRGKKEGEGEESASSSYRGRGGGRPYYGRGRGRGGRGGSQRYNREKS